MKPSEIRKLLPYMTENERAQVLELLHADTVPWRPLPGPQTMAFESEADIIGYGGAAGGGKTDLACGKAIRSHEKTMILRREGTQLTGVIDRLKQIVGNDIGFNGQEKIWRMADRQIEFGSTPHAGDETKYQGRPHDLLVFDEAANFLEIQVRFLLGWLRTTKQGQKCQALLTFNPPTSAEGRWIIEFFAPWLDSKHPRPALPGELRWFASIEGKDIERENGDEFIHNDEVIKPMSRTFIPSRVTDNPYLMGTGYMSTLQSLPEPLRSQMLNGDFAAGMEDDPWQVIPTRWVDVAMNRWKEPDKRDPMDSLGIDVARGGKDLTVIARRHGMWFDKPVIAKGIETDSGPKVAGLVIANTRDGAAQHIDVIGIGASPYDFLTEARQHVLGINVSETSYGSDRSGMLTFFNQRSEYWWKFREALDPDNNTGIALPPDQRLRADLCAPKWKLSGKTIQVESREGIVDRIGRSPDFASAYILALIDTPKLNNMGSLYRSVMGGRVQRDHDPYDDRGVRGTSRREYDPYKKN